MKEVGTFINQKEWFCNLHLCINIRASLVAQRLKRLPGVRETRVRSLSWEDPLGKEMAPHSSTLAWRIPWREQPGRLQSMGLQRVGHDWLTSLHFMIWQNTHIIQTIVLILFCPKWFDLLKDSWDAKNKNPLCFPCWFLVFFVGFFFFFF